MRDYKSFLKIMRFTMHMYLFSGFSLYQNCHRNRVVFLPVLLIPSSRVPPVWTWRSILLDDTLYGLPRRYVPRIDLDL
jgi:hypothetical protein